MKQKIRRLDVVLILNLIAFINGLLLICWPDQIMKTISWSIVLTFILNLIVFTIFLIINMKLYHFSFISIVMIFNIFFFVFAPFIQYLNNEFPWEYVANNKNILYANGIILFFTIIVETIYLLIHKKISKKLSIRKTQTLNDFNNTLQNSKKVNIVLYGFTVLSIIIAIFMVARVGILGIFEREVSRNAFEFCNSQAIVTLCEAIARWSTCFTLLFNIIYIFKYKKHYTRFVLSIISMLLVCFPFALVRFVMAGMYLGLIIIIFPKIKTNKLFIYIFIIAILLAFPLLSIVRNESIFSLNIVEVFPKIGEIIKSSILSGDFDAYTCLMRAIDYVDAEGITWGRQLLGCILFFIPRQWWTSKPIGSGSLVSINLGETFNNISMPFIGEGLINFGLIGVMLFAILLGTISAIIDYNYWDRNTLFINYLYPFLLGIVFFAMRGDLLSSTAQIVGIVAIYSFIYVILNLKESDKKKEILSSDVDKNTNNPINKDDVES